MTNFGCTDYFLQKLVLFVSCKLGVTTVDNDTILPVLLLWRLFWFLLWNILLWLILLLQLVINLQHLFFARNISKIIIIINVLFSFICIWLYQLIHILNIFKLFLTELLWNFQLLFWNCLFKHELHELFVLVCKYLYCIVNYCSNLFRGLV